MNKDQYEAFLKDKDAVWRHLDRYAHLYEQNPFYLADFIRSMDKMSHKKRVELIKTKGLIKIYE